MIQMCTCPGGDLPTCGFCEGFERWDESLSDAQRGELALAFLDSLTPTKLTGYMVGEPESRAPWIGHNATIEWNGLRAFDGFLADTYAAVRDARLAA